MKISILNTLSAVSILTSANDRLCCADQTDYQIHGKYDQKGQCQISWKVAFEISPNPFINTFCILQILQFCCRYLCLIVIIFPNLTILYDHDLIDHILNGIIMRYNQHCRSIGRIDLLQKDQDIP